MLGNQFFYSIYLPRYCRLLTTSVGNIVTSPLEPFPIYMYRSHHKSIVRKKHDFKHKYNGPEQNFMKPT